MKRQWTRWAKPARLGPVIHFVHVVMIASIIATALFAGGIRWSESHRLPAGSSTIQSLAFVPSCPNQRNWDYCTGEDPQSQGCTAQYTASAAIEYYNSSGQYVDDGELDNRYAGNCESNWARTFTYCCADPIYAKISGTDPYYGYYSNQAGWSTTTILWSLMIFAPSITTTACGGFPNYGYSHVYPPQACRNQ